MDSKEAIARGAIDQLWMHLAAIPNCAEDLLRIGTGDVRPDDAPLLRVVTILVAGELLARGLDRERGG